MSPSFSVSHTPVLSVQVAPLASKFVARSLTFATSSSDSLWFPLCGLGCNAVRYHREARSCSAVGFDSQAELRVGHHRKALT